MLFKNRFPKGGPTCRRQVVNPRHQTPQGQSNSPAEYPSWVARCDIKGSDGTMLNPIFWKKVQGQKHPGRWRIVEHQIPSIKVLFKTNTKSHKHPVIKIFAVWSYHGIIIKLVLDSISHRNFIERISNKQLRLWYALNWNLHSQKSYCD